MSRLTIDTGTAGNPATGDSLRGAFTKVNTNFAELYAELGGDSLDAISFNNNTISTDITNANLILTGNGTGGVVIEDIEITGSTVNVLTTNNNLTLNTNGTGKVVINGLSFPTTDGTAGQVLKTDGAGNLSFTAVDPGAITIVGDDSSGTAVNIGETFKIAGAGTVTTAVSGDTLTITGTASTGDFTFSGNTLSTASSNADMELDPAGTGNLILKSGNFLPQTDDTQDLGSASKRWRDLYVGPGTVKVGDTSTGLQYGSAGVYSGDGGTLIMRIDPPDGAGNHYVAFDESVREVDMSQAEIRVRDILPPQDGYGNTQTDISVGGMKVRNEYDFSTSSPLLVTPENTNQDLALSPNGTGRVEIQSRDTVLGHSGADTYVRLTTKFNKDLVLDTQSGSNSGTITIPSGENSDISIEPNGTGEVTVTTNSNEFIFKSDGSFEFPDSTTQSTAANITVVGDDSTGTTFNAGETIRIAGTSNITTAVSGDTLTITGSKNIEVNEISSGDSSAIQINDAVNVSGAVTANSSLTANTFIQMGNGSATTLAAGRLWYDENTGALNAGMGGGNITQQIGEELFRYGKASSAINDNPLQLIYKTGTVGGSGVITFAPAVAGITNDHQILGCATEPIAENGFGRITAYGVINNIATNGSYYGETWADNDDIYYNPATGGLTKTIPTSGLKLLIGTVITAGAGGSGKFIVKLGVSASIGNSSDVTITSVAANDILRYNGTAWVNTPGNITVVGDDSTGTTLNLGETVRIAGTQNITTAVSGDTLTITGPNLSSYLTAVPKTIDVNEISSGDSSAIQINDAINVSGAGTFHGSVRFNAGYTENINTLTSSSTITVNCATASIHKVTLAVSTGFVISNLPSGGTVTLIITQGGSGSYAATFGTDTSTTVKFPGGAPTLSTALGAIDVVTIFNDGTNYLGNIAKAYAA